MAKPLELVTEISGEDAKRFLKKNESPISKENKTLINNAKNFKYTIKK